MHSIRYDEVNIPYIIYAWVDHVLLKRKFSLIEYIEIIASGLNEGDHNSIKSPNSLTETLILKKKAWNKLPVLEEYSDKAE